MTARLQFRRATPDDANQISALVRSAYAKWVPVIGREPMPMRVDYLAALRIHRIDLLHADGALFGLIESQQQPDHLWIENVAVHPDQQGRGFGQALLAHAETLATEAGLAELRLLTNAAFVDNIALYHKRGYRLDRTEPFHLGGATAYMSKSLG